jgi:hypothetical protein
MRSEPYIVERRVTLVFGVNFTVPIHYCFVYLEGKIGWPLSAAS